VCQEIRRSLSYGQQSLNIFIIVDPIKAVSLLDQLHSAIARDDLLTIAVDSGTVVGALKHLKLGKSDR